MDGILNILIVLGFIGFAIYRQLLKPSENDSPKNTPPVPFGMEEVFPELEPSDPVIYSPPTTPDTLIVKRDSKKTFRETKPREVITSPLQEEDDAVNSDIDTQSIEEIRKGIIWSEILNRKY